MSLRQTLRRAWCVVNNGGHEWLLRSDPHPSEGQARHGRVYQACGLCGAERPGWTIDTDRAWRLERRRMTAEQQRKVVQMRRRRA